MKNQVIIKPDSTREKFLLSLPADMKMKARIICLKRKITLTDFIKEAVGDHIKKYDRMFQ